MAFGQKTDVLPRSWGVAPGYGEEGLRPKKRMSAHVPGALPQATVKRPSAKKTDVLPFLGRCPRLR